MRNSITPSAVGRLILFSLLITQAIVWALEIRSTGFKPWIDASLRRSYARYIGSFGRIEWLRFACIFFLLLVTLSAVWFAR
jgi:hypothetical protein